MNSTKQERLDHVNEFILSISNCGRKFFKHDGFVSTLELSKSGRVFFIDYYTKKRIYTHKDGRWVGFTSGGTLHLLIECLRDFVTKGDQMDSKYFDFAEGFKTNHWGYGADILIVKESGLKLGILK